MALILHQPIGDPIGQWPLLAALVSTVKGGEIVTLGSVNTGAQTGAADLADGYQDGGLKQIVLTTSLTGGATTKPLFILDDGLLHYGTLFGSVVGGTVGTTSFGPNSTIPAADQLGPPTALASGKGSVFRAGLFGVTLDNVAASLQPSTYTGTSGSILYAATSTGSGSSDGAGILTASTGSSNNVPVGYFVEFRSNGSLVTTPNRLVSALNSPSSVVGGVLSPSLFQVVFSMDTSLV